MCAFYGALLCDMVCFVRLQKTLTFHVFVFCVTAESADVVRGAAAGVGSADAAGDQEEMRLEQELSLVEAEEGQQQKEQSQSHIITVVLAGKNCVKRTCY